MHQRMLKPSFCFGDSESVRSYVLYDIESQRMRVYIQYVKGKTIVICHCRIRFLKNPEDSKKIINQNSDSLKNRREDNMPFGLACTAGIQDHDDITHMQLAGISERSVLHSVYYRNRDLIYSKIRTK
jgi:hypothetical protein